MLLPKSLVATAIFGLVLSAAIGYYISGYGQNQGARQIKTPVIRTSAESNDYLERARKLSEKLVMKFDAGDTLTAQELDDVREAAAYWSGIKSFDPTQYGPYYGEGKLRFMMGDYQDAFSLMVQCINLAPPPTKPPAPPPPLEAIQTVADAHYIASQCLMNLQRYGEAAEAASLAVSLAPDSPDYLVAEARAQLQLGKSDAATALVVRALQIDINHRGATTLAKFMHIEDLLKGGSDKKGKPANKGKIP